MQVVGNAKQNSACPLLQEIGIQTHIMSSAIAQESLQVCDMANIICLELWTQNKNLDLSSVERVMLFISQANGRNISFGECVLFIQTSGQRETARQLLFENFGFNIQIKGSNDVPNQLFR